MAGCSPTPLAGKLGIEEGFSIDETWSGLRFVLRKELRPADRLRPSYASSRPSSGST
jgi:hypothetical protein